MPRSWSIPVPRWLRLVAVACLCSAAVGLVLLSLEGFGWGWFPATVFAVLLVFGSAWLGWAVRQAWIYPAWLRRAEGLWVSGAPAAEVADALAKVALATGELGHRVWLLRSKAHLAMGFRDIAWLESEEAHLARVPFWLRGALRRRLRAPAREGTGRTDLLWLRLAPAMPRLAWCLAEQRLRRDTPADRREAWSLLLGALSQAGEDPMLLEDLMLALLERLHELQNQEGNLGRQTTEPELRAAFERVLDLLLHRHGSPRIGWDRTSPAKYLLREERFEEVLGLVHSLSPELRPEALWVVFVAALKGMGDREGAWNATLDGLSALPGSFRLWMMRQDLALELGRSALALQALGRAREVLDRMDPVSEAFRWEWHLRRAEYAYWIDRNPEEAWTFLRRIPEDRQGGEHPPLRLLVQLDLGQYGAVQPEVARLLEQRPDDVDLQLLQADCLAGMGAWDALSACLAQAGAPTQERPDFWHLRGICRAHLGDLRGAREDLERCAQMEADNLRFVLDAGHACADLGEWVRSEQHWRQALRLDERCEEAFTQLAESRRMLHDPEGARRLLRECLLHHPESPSAQALLAELEAN